MKWGSMTRQAQDSLARGKDKDHQHWTSLQRVQMGGGGASGLEITPSKYPGTSSLHRKKDASASSGNPW